MIRNAAFSKVAKRALTVQCGLLVVAGVSAAASLSKAFGYLLGASLFAGLVAFLCGLVAAFIAREVRWVALSVAALFVGASSLLIGIVLGGHPGV